MGNVMSFSSLFAVYATLASRSSAIFRDTRAESMLNTSDETNDSADLPALRFKFKITLSDFIRNLRFFGVREGVFAAMLSKGKETSFDIRSADTLDFIAERMNFVGVVE